jgi:aryl-alcohol dehydrogenase-like predicted oxidoreductase
VLLAPDIPIVCWEYHRGKSEDWMGAALEGVRDKVFLMTKVCTHGRDGSLAMQMGEPKFGRSIGRIAAWESKNLGSSKKRREP